MSTPENDWILYQSPAGTLDDPEIEMQTSTDHRKTSKGLKGGNSKPSVIN